MKRIIGWTIFFVIIALVIAYGYRMGWRIELAKVDTDTLTAGIEHKGEESQAMSSISPATSAKKKERKILYWRAPMDPTYISDKPGKSPMGMDLIPVYEGEEDVAEPGTVKIDPITVQNIGVRTEIVKKRPLKRVIRTVGRIDYNEKKIDHIHTKIDGWIEKLYVDFTGQEVKKGDPLLDIYSPELVSTQEEYLLALRFHKSLSLSPFKEISEGADSLIKSTRRRLLFWDINEAQIKALEEKEEVTKTMTLHSPSRGIVKEKIALEGMYVKPGMNLFTIADISTVWVYADIYEYELPWIRLGQRANMELPYLPGKTFTGKVTYIYPFLEAKTRTVKVRMEFPNPTWELKPDMYADVRIEENLGNDAIAVPEEAVIFSGERPLVIVDKGNGRFEPREIKLGVDTGDYFQVLEGLHEGERVVTSANFLIDSESKLKEALNKMLGKKMGKKEEREETEAGKEHKEMKMASSTTKISQKTKRAMGKILDHYLEIKKNLAQDSLEGIIQAARAIALEADTIAREEENEELRNMAKEIEQRTRKLNNEDIKVVRAEFAHLSQPIITYLKEYYSEEAKTKGYSIFYCSMEDKSWVQKGKEVANPYLGPSMLRCGTEVDY
jgi:multidrug efflux pump subunit AcrA (membrane-fusion protein)